VIPSRLLAAILIAAVAGVLCGWLFPQPMTAIGWVGELFLDAVRMTILPLIVAAVISGIASLGDARRFGRLGALTVAWFALSTAAAVLLGQLLAVVLQPGAPIGAGAAPPAASQAGDTGAAGILRSIIAPNVLAAAAESQFLPVMIFALLFGCALSTIGPRGATVHAFFDGVLDVMMKLIGWIMVLSPIGIFALLAARLGAAGGGAGVLRELTALGLYTLTVCIGLALHAGLMLALLVAATRRRQAFLGNLLPALLTAFGTGSSAATMPVAIQGTIDGGVDRRIANFVLPMGTVFNRNGTGLYQAVAVLFIAQVYGAEPGFGGHLVLLLTATLATISAAGVPQSGLVTMTMVLTALNLPLEGIGLLLAVDWFLDRLRTVNNVLANCVGCALIEPLAERGPRR
jgi:Na+/H+-dicarboxylate symporter